MIILVSTEVAMLLREAEIVYTAKRIEGSAKIATADDVMRICRDLERLTVEHFVVLCLNAQHRVLCRQTVAMGTAGAVGVHPRDVFRAAVMAGATAVILVHNHPSGEPGPSADDRRITQRLVEAGVLLGVPVLDHVIVAWGADRFSFAEVEAL